MHLPLIEKGVLIVGEENMKLDMKGLRIIPPSGYVIVPTYTTDGILEVSFKEVDLGYVTTDFGVMFSHLKGLKAMRLTSEDGFKYRQVVGFKWQGVEYTVGTWSDLFNDLLRELLFANPVEFEKMVDNNVCKKRGSNVGYVFKKTVSDTKDSIHIGRGYFVSKSIGGGEGAKRLLLSVFEAMNLNIEDLYIYTVDKNSK